MNRYFQSSWISIFVTLLFAGLTIFVWNQLQNAEENDLKELSLQAEIDILKEIKTRLKYQTNALKRLAGRWEMYADSRKGAWEKDVLAHVEHYPGYRAIQWIDPELVISWVVPIVGNEEIYKVRADFDENRQNALNTAREKRSIYISPVLELRQGGHGFLVYIPVYLQEQFNGFIVGVIDIEIFLSAILDDHVPAYDILITSSEDGEPVYIRSTNGIFVKNNFTQHITFSVDAMDLEIFVQPTNATLLFEESYLPGLVLATGLLIALLVGVLIYLVQATYRTTDQLKVANSELQREIKERENAELAKDKLKRALLQSQKLEAIGTLAGGIAHDFNNILYSVIGYVEMALEDLNKDTIIHKNLLKVVAVSKRGQELVARLLSFSRQQQHSFEVISLLEVLHSTLTLLKPTIPASVEIVEKIEVKKAVIKGSHTDLQQVFVNIVGNAVDAMEGKGTVEICLKQVVSDEKLRSEHPTLTQASYYLLEIVDNGPGMSKATLERAFEPFFTTKPVGKGTGLGLATAHGIIQEHDGVIGIRSELAQGTVVYIYLPQLRADE